jgi:hypothetical protein
VGRFGHVHVITPAAANGCNGRLAEVAAPRQLERRGAACRAGVDTGFGHRVGLGECTIGAGGQ